MSGPSNQVQEMLNRIEWESMPKEKAQTAKLMVEIASMCDQHTGPNGEKAFDGKQAAHLILSVASDYLGFIQRNQPHNSSDESVCVLISGLYVIACSGMHCATKAEKKMIRKAIKSLIKDDGFSPAKFK